MLAPYVNNNCRSFDPSLLVQNFDMDKFQGRWYNQYVSKFAYPVDQGSCKVTWVQMLSPLTEADFIKYPALQKVPDILNSSPFIRRDVQVQNGQVTDFLQRGLQIPSPNNNTVIIWNANSLVPSQNKFFSKVQILSTDYENYGIVYRCAQNKLTSKFYGDEQIIVYTRNRQEYNQTTKSQIEIAFNSLFSPSTKTSPFSDKVSSGKEFKQLNFKNDMQKISQDGCDLLIPDTFNFLKGIPLKFASKINGEKVVPKTIKDDSLNSNAASDV